MKNKLKFDAWLDKYFEKDDDHTYYVWTFTDDGMVGDDITRWKDMCLLEEFERYLNNDINSHVGLEDYDE